MSSISNFDPTGIVAIAAAFVKPVCDLRRALSHFEEEELGKRCIKVFTECGFKGKS